MFQAMRKSAVQLCCKVGTKASPLAKQSRFLSREVAKPAVQNLHSILMKEFKEEANANEPNEEYEEIKTLIEKTFKIDETVGTSVVKLTSTFKGEEITVKFDVQEQMDDENQEFGGEEGEDGEEGDEFDGEGEGGTVQRFFVEIKKESGTLGFDCTAGEKVEIKNVQILPQGLKFDDPKAGELYAGPQFQDLDEKLQDTFYSYLEARKIDDDLSFFVQSHAVEKERVEYIHWLKSVAEFVNTKPSLK